MKIVDVLRDHGRDGAAPHEFGHGFVPCIWLGAPNIGVDSEFAAPGLAAHLLTRHKVLKLNGRHLRPNAARTAKIGDSGFCRDPGAREDDRPRAIGQ